jgi:glycosyltransferase involved in cell wall biosynthesis
MRREHAFATLALRRGIDVVFIEPPVDVRSLRNISPIKFAKSLGGTMEPDPSLGLRLISRSSPVPGHRNRVAELADAALLRHVLGQFADPTSPTICHLPWHWPAVVGQNRKIFDCADDWARLFPEARRPRFHELYGQIAAQADEIVVASSVLSELFEGRSVTVIPNGTEASDIATDPRPPPGQRHLAYVGTITERFDSKTVAEILSSLPEWSLDLYGSFRYEARGDRPSVEFGQLLQRFAGQLHWHGQIPRDATTAAIDGADVIIVPHRSEIAFGQSSMKLYDSAARGRPAVVSEGVSVSGDELPPLTYVAKSKEDWLEAIVAAASENHEAAEDRIVWARSNTWDHRWPAWERSVFGANAARRLET